MKQIYAALELGNGDIKILVAEYYNTRFNIIRVEKAFSAAINDFKLVDKELFKKDLKGLFENASNKIGSRIEKVILVLPSYNFKRFPLRSSVVPNNGIVSKADIGRAISNSLRVKVDSDAMVANAVINRYIINGIPTRRMPENEACNDMQIDIDLLCCNKEMAYEYVSAIEETGIEILDVCLNSYAICKEASLLEESLKENIILLEICKDVTYLSLLSKGKIISTEVVFEGIDCMVDKVFNQMRIPRNDILKLIKYDLDYNDEYLDDVIYAWSVKNDTKTLTGRQLNELVEKELDDYIENLSTMCKPILDNGASIVVTGEGAEVKALIGKLENIVGSKIRMYYPETIGVRDPEFTAIYGSLYAYRDKVLLNNLSVNCVDLQAYDELIEEREIDTEGETITTKIKNLFKQYMDREDN